MPRRTSSGPRSARRVSSVRSAAKPAPADDHGLIDWNVTPTRAYSGERHRQGHSASRADIAGIFMGGLMANGAASTVNPGVLEAFSESPPKADDTVSGGCVDLLWGDFDGLDVIGAQFAVVGGADPFDAIDQIFGRGSFDDAMSASSSDSSDSDSDDKRVGDNVGDNDNGDDDDDNGDVDNGGDDDDDNGDDDDDNAAYNGGGDILGSALAMLDRLDEDDEPRYAATHGMISVADEFKNAALVQ